MRDQALWNEMKILADLELRRERYRFTNPDRLWNFEDLKKDVMNRISKLPESKSEIWLDMMGGYTHEAKEEIFTYLKRNGFNPVLKKESNDFAPPYFTLIFQVPAGFNRAGINKASAENSAHALSTSRLTLCPAPGAQAQAAKKSWESTHEYEVGSF